MARGGYQAPNNPAPVPMPGKLSRRTDGGPADPRQPVRDLPNPAYGEGQQFRAAEQAAPMATAPTPPNGPPQVQQADLSNVVPLNAPTQQPNQPVTAGAALGPGPGPDALALGQGDDPGVAKLKAMLPALELMANSPAASYAFKQFVRRTRAIM